MRHFEIPNGSATLKRNANIFFAFFSLIFFLRPIKCSSLPAIKRLPFSKNITGYVTGKKPYLLNIAMQKKINQKRTR